MRQIILICTMLLCLSAARAQYVAIPDSNFGNWLHANGFATCLTGNGTIGYHLDTTASVLTSTTTITISNKGVVDLKGIEYFKNLGRLQCDHNKLTSLPPLQNSITILLCSYNKIASIPFLPNNLSWLICDSNLLTSLPTLPNSLVLLTASGNRLTALPALPPSLGVLYCNYNLLNNLPPLPHSLTCLVCNSNHLNALPTLSNTLNILYCDHNQLTSLPSIPAHLAILVCDHNQLTSLPVLPDTLRELHCNANSNLSCLPNGFRHIVDLKIDSTQISCFPNRFLCDNCTSNIPLCTPASGCPMASSISGKAHQDTSSSCLLDSLNNGAIIYGIKIFMSDQSQVLRQTYAQPYGYTFIADSAGVYQVSLDTSSSNPFNIICPFSKIRTITTTLSDSLFLNQDFGLQCKGIDNGVISMYGRFRVSKLTTVNINGGDIARHHGTTCSNHSSGIVTTSIAGSVHYISAALGALTPTSVSGNTLFYSVIDFDSIKMGDFDIIVLTDTQAVIGSSVCITTIVTTSGGIDINSANDSLTQCFHVVNSWDPNYKSASPATVPTAGGWLTYTVEFQNTGTDTAYTVVVKDTLSNNVDASTFQYLASDHKAVIQLFGNVMVFTFPKINLVDSAHNAAKSTGWIQYKVKSKPNLIQGTPIKNTAYIYFDNNAAVVTNTTSTMVGTTGINTLPAEDGFIKLFPNPNKGSFTLQTSGSIHEYYTISDMLGHIVAQQFIIADTQPIDLSDVAEGVYTIAVRGAKPLRFVVVR